MGVTETSFGFGGTVISFFHYLFALLVPFPLLVYGVNLGDQGRRRIGRLGLDRHFGHIAFCMGLQELQKACLGFTLKHHRIRYTWGFLDTTYLGWREVAKVNNRRFWKLRLIKDLKIVLEV